jgi:hypothetical protein
MSEKKFLVLSIGVLIALGTAYAVMPPEEVWNIPYTSGDFTRGSDLVVDAQGNVFVAGEYDNGMDNDFLLIKYDPEGIVLWFRTFDSGGDDEPRAIALDADGNVYVCGSFVDTLNPGTVHARLLKYSPAGDSLLNSSYALSDFTRLYAITIDKTGGLYMAGYTMNPSNSDYLVMKCDPGSGDTLWTKIYDSGREEAVNGIAVDTLGNIYVTGTAGGDTDTTDVRTIKYSPSRSILWNELFDGGSYDDAGGLALDGQGNVLVGLSSYNSSGNSDYRIIKYDSGGGVVWNKYYDAGSYDDLYGIATDASGNAYVTGVSQSGPSNDDIRTIKYTPSGDIEWYKVYDSGTLYDIAMIGDGASGIALDQLGYVYVTGYYATLVNVSICTIKYRQFFTIAGKTSQPYATLKLEGATTAETESDSNGYYKFLDLAGGKNYTVTPSLEGFTFEPPYRKYSPLTDHMMLEDYTGTPTGVEELKPVLKTSLEASANNVKYTVDKPGFVKLCVYDACGRKIASLFEGNSSSGEFNVLWKPQTSGVYFVKLDVSDRQITRKVTILF